MSTKKSVRQVLVVEDDPGLQSQLKWALEGYDVKVAQDRESAVAHVRRFEPAVVTLDLGLPPDPANESEGLAALTELLAIAPHTKIIVVTGNDDRDNALRCIAQGAYDFYEKPVEPEVLNLIVDRAYRLHELESENRRLQTATGPSAMGGIVGASAELEAICRTVERIAPADVSVLFLGESGTGKELFTRALHELSGRKNERLVAINCAAIPENLLESELFGYEKGAFTGATKQTIGKIESANNGTLFLDEIGDLPQSLQAKLLRFLQERTIERLGGRNEIPVNVRVVSATHQNLEDKIKDGSFREDLFYRISEISVKIPPLRERTGDAVLLANAYLHKYSAELSRPLRGFTDEALSAISQYQWPGNARELENRVKRAVLLADAKVVDAPDLELEALDSGRLPLNLRQVREDAESQAVKRALALSSEKVAAAADLLGVSRPTLYDLIEKYGLK